MWGNSASSRRTTLTRYWEETVTAVRGAAGGADPLGRFLPATGQTAAALPYAGDDLDVTLRTFADLARRDGVSVHLPTLWQRTDPWT